jgi:ribonucleotide reductase alpha subunit
MCPDQCPSLVNSYGKEFEELYLKYEKEGNFKKQVKAKDLWLHILESQIETGMPYVVMKDSMNEKSNQKNVGVINSSNLCSEICEVYDKENYAVCNLASICLPKFVKYNESGEPFYDYE